MNQDERKKLDEAHELAQRNHAFWHEPPTSGAPTRAEGLDRLLYAARFGSTTVFILLRLAAVVTAAAAIYASLRGLWPWSGDT